VTGALSTTVASGTSGLLAGIGASVLQVIGVAVGGPLLLGLMAKVRARAEGRRGAPVTQVLADLRKLVRKEAVRAHHTSVVSLLAPRVLVASSSVAVAMSPLLTTRPVAARGADLFAVVFLLLVGSVALALLGLDAGTAFGGMGSSRAMTVGAISEPALLVAVVALAVQSQTSNLPGLVTASLAHPGWLASPQRLLALVALVIVVIAETGRLPVDNPSTHLELTMIHEAMILECAGPDLALVTVGEAMRLGLLLGLLANLFFPWGVGVSGSLPGILGGMGALAAKTALVAALIAVVEVSTAKLRLFRVPELLAGAFVLGIVAVTTALVSR